MDDPNAGAVRNEEHDADVTVRVSGAQAFSWQGRTQLRITRAGKPGLAVNVLSVGMPTPQALDDPRASFRWAFDLLDQFADAPGSFPLRRGDEGSQVTSNALVIFIRAKEGVPLPPQREEDTEAFLQFDQVLRDCQISIDDDLGLVGRIDCPELADADGRSVSMQATWQIDAAAER